MSASYNSRLNMALTKNSYILPFKKKCFIDAVSDPQAHFAHLKYAIDFGLLEGTEILAAKSGVVVAVKVDSNEGGLDSKYRDDIKLKYLNYITLKHSNGEYSWYAHLKYKSAFVKIGGKIRTGQPIALSGNTGFSSEPHLHFQVFKLNKTKIGWEPLEVRLREKIKVSRD